MIEVSTNLQVSTDYNKNVEFKGMNVITSLKVYIYGI